MKDLYIHSGLVELVKYQSLPLVIVDLGVVGQVDVRPTDVREYAFEEAVYCVSWVNAQDGYKNSSVMIVNHLPGETRVVVFLKDPFDSLTMRWDHENDALTGTLSSPGQPLSSRGIDKKMAQDLRVLAGLVNRKLTQSHAHIVLVESTTPTPEKTARKKPWLRSTPRHIVIDPSEAVKYGAPRGPVGTHASPEPHHRRGHWRKLVSDRYSKQGESVWVRPAWVGPREWIYQGQEYRVVT